MKIPKPISDIIAKLEKSGFEAFIVGGCVRDIIREVEPNDWDIATNAKPEQIQELFKKSFSNNDFGTVTVITGSKDEKLNQVEITPYRIDEKYTDKRHPDKISWAKTIEQDLSRRDFTVNAMAMNKDIIDPFKGRQDLENRIIRAVGDPDKRFSEDALRMMRAVRFAVSLKSKIEENTFKAIQKNADLLKFISQERIRDELMKIIMCNSGALGIEILRRLGLLQHIIPELEQGFGVWQNKHHIYQIYQHAILSLDYACRQGYSKEVRLAALFHDIGKSEVKEGEGMDSTFYNHEIVGAKMTYKIMRRLRFPKKQVEKVTKLVRYHLFYYNVGEVGESSVRRLLRKVGKEYIEDLLQVRYSDRIGSGVPKAEPYKLRHLKYLFERVSQDPISPQNLKITGNDIMNILHIKPGPKIGKILTYLLSEALKDPNKNDKQYLKAEVERLGKIGENELDKVFKQAREEIEGIETKRDEMTKKKYWVT